MKKKMKTFVKEEPMCTVKSQKSFSLLHCACRDVCTDLESLLYKVTQCRRHGLFHYFCMAARLFTLLTCFDLFLNEVMAYYFVSKKNLNAWPFFPTQLRTLMSSLWAQIFWKIRRHFKFFYKKLGPQIWATFWLLYFWATTLKICAFSKGKHTPMWRLWPRGKLRILYFASLHYSICSTTLHCNFVQFILARNCYGF